MRSVRLCTRVAYRAAVLSLCLFAHAASAVQVGYYDMGLGAGDAAQVPPIVAAGHTAVQLFDLSATELAGVDVLMAQNPSNGSYGAEYLLRLPEIEAAVTNGLILVLHDRYVSNPDGTGGARTILPGGAGFTVARNFDDANNLEIRDPVTPVTNGAGGVLTATSLDNGSFSSHGFATASTLPALARLILARTDLNQIVTFAYPFGDGAVLYSTIPLDQFLAGCGPNPSCPRFAQIYAPNVVDYAARLSLGIPDLDVALTDLRTVAIPGTSVSYTLTVANFGAGTANAASVTAAFPPTLTGVTWTCAPSVGASCTPSGSGGIADTVTIPLGGVLTYVATGTVLPSATGTLTATATAQPASGSDPIPTNNTAVDVDTLVPTADLRLAKSGPASVTPGGALTYQLTVTNAGPSDATGVSLADPEPVGLALTGVGAPCASGFPCALGTLVPGGQVTVMATYTVDDPYLGPDPLVNLASVSGQGVDPAPANNTARSAIAVGRTASANVALSLTGPPSAARSSSVVFRLRVQNLGSDDATGLLLSHTPPPGLPLQSISAPCSGGLPCALGGLNPGGSVEVEVRFGIPGGYAGADPFSYSAAVTATTPDPTPANNTATVSVPLGGDTADLRLTKVSPASVALGGDLVATLTVTNRGPATATGVVLDDPTPAGLSFVAADPPCAAGFPCALGSLTAGASVTVRVAFHVPPGYAGANPIVNQATVAGSPTDGFPADNTASASTGVGGELADLAITKAAPSEAAAGTDLPYTLLVTNRGPGVARNVLVEELSPASLGFAGATAPCTGGFPCNLGDLPPGGSRLIGLNLAIAPDHVAPNPVTNTASVDTTSLDADAGNDSSSTTTTVIYVADLGVTKTNGRTQNSPGLPAVYTITVTNQGPSDVFGATVADPLPAGLTGATWSCAASGGAVCTPSGAGSITDTVDLPAGSTLVYTLSATVAAGASGTLSNTASVAVPGGVDDPVAGNNSATDTDVLVAPANLEVLKLDPAQAVPGTNLVYTIEVRNLGTGTALGVSLADPTPPGLTFVSASAPCGAGFPCALGSLASGALATVTVTYAVPAAYTGPDPILNTASATTTTPESDASNDQATASTPVVRLADLAATKTDGRTTVVPGQSVTYTLTIQNLGPSNAPGTLVTDTPPAVLLGPSWTCSGAGGGACGAPSGTGAISQTVNLPVGGSVTYLLTATVDPAASSAVVNQVTAAAGGGVTDPVAGNNTASDASGLAPLADLAVTKTDGRATAVPGEPLVYTVTVSNLGPSNVAGATITDNPPAALLSPSWTCSGTGGGVCPAAAGSGGPAGSLDLPAGGSVTFLLTGTVDPAATGTLTNTASVALPPAVADPVLANNSATDTDTLTRVARLSLTKTGPGTVARGGALTYGFVVANAGPSDALVELTDPTPPGLVFTSVGAPCTGGFPCSLGTLAAGASVAFSATYTVPAGYVGPDPILNQAALKSDAADPQPADNRVRSATAVDRAASADLAVNKSAPSVATLGSTVTYTLTVTNLGPDDAAGVQLAETIPAGLTFVSATAPCAGGFTCALGALPLGASRTVEVTLAIPADYGGPTLIVNTASVSATTADPSTANNSAAAVTSLVAAAADLAVTKTGPVRIAAGQDVLYTLRVTNRGPTTSTNTRLNDPTPPGLSFVGATAPCAGGFPCFLDALAPGQSVTVQATFRVPAGYAGPNPIANTASAQANELDGVAANDSATALTGVGADAADLAVTQTGLATARAGEVLPFTIVVSNLGPGTAAGTTLADPAPAGTTFVSASPPCSGGFPCNLGDLPAGTSVALEARFRTSSALAAGTVVTNTAIVTTTSADAVSANNIASASTTLAVAADLAITKTDGAATEIPGTTVTYTITASNAGPSDAPGAVVTDTFPAALSGVGWTCAASPGSSCGGGGGTGNLARTVNLLAGGNVVFTATGTINAGATGSLSNTATVAAPGGVPDPVAGNNSATDTDTLAPEADLAVTKTDGVASEIPGTTVTYTITVSNAGPSHAPGAVVQDTFPSALSGVTWTCSATSGSSCTAAGSGTIFDTVTVLAGGSVTYTATGTLDPAATGTLSNTATVTAPGSVPDPNPANNSATDTDTLTPQADLAMAKTDGITSALPGTSVIYTLTVTNAGPSHAPGSLVTDTFPPAVTAVTWTCTASGGATCGAPSGSGNLAETVNLPAGGQLVYTATASLDLTATGTLSNTATVAVPSGTTDPSPANNSATDTDALLLATRLAITQSANRASYLPGDLMVYTLTATNDGPAPANNARVRDLLPASFGGTSWTCMASGGATCPAADTGNVDELVTLPVGGQVIFTVSTTIQPAATGPLTNLAEVLPPSGAGDPVPGDNAASTTVTLAVALFGDGFESGDTSAWAATVP